MQVINKKIVIFIGLIIFIFGLFKLFNKKEIVLDDVILDMKDTNNVFAIYIEDYDDNGNASYVESKENNFPKEGYAFNKKLSGCIDTYGNDVKDVLSYEEDIGVSINTNKTLYCYIYFDKGAGLKIINEKPKGLNLDVTSSSEEWTGMYRFQGQQSEGIENYICFGTSDSNECKTKSDKYMYRIIGIEENGRIKVIKKEALNEKYQWYSDGITDIIWPNSLIFAAINGVGFLDNQTYVPENFKDKIDDNNWLYGQYFNNSPYGATQTGLNLYKTEIGQTEACYPIENGNTFITECYLWEDTIPSKISLMYVSDYYLAVDNEANCQEDFNNFNNCKTSWIHLSLNDEKNVDSKEWTMVYYGFSSSNHKYRAQVINTVGSLGIWESIADFNAIRPVFFLKNNISLIDGKGTIDEPFIIE